MTWCPAPPPQRNPGKFFNTSTNLPKNRSWTPLAMRYSTRKLESASNVLSIAVSKKKKKIEDCSSLLTANNWVEIKRWILSSVSITKKIES